MLLLLLFTFISGFITILAPCIWPLLPLILSTTVTGGHKKPIGVVFGIMISFGLLTLSLSYIVKIFPFDPNALRLFSVVVITFLGLTLLIPKLSAIMEGAVSRLSGGLAQNFMVKNTNGFLGGLLTGLVLGIVWTPCAGPILATIATLAATNSVNAGIILVTIVYLIGVGIPLFIFALFGRYIFTKSRALSKHTGQIQQVFGVILLLTALLIFTNYDKRLQAGLLDLFPSYGNTLIKFESNKSVKNQLNKLKGGAQSINDQTDNNELFNENNSAPEFTGITNWLNTEKPLTIKDLKGKVILVDFWTYTCINCIRTLPHLINWYEKYKNEGFIIISVHTPEFEFEKNTSNVTNALKQYGINYPVAQDNNYETWNAYSNQYWPAEYLIDSKGNIRRSHFGEGKYDETESAIQVLLKESGKDINVKLDNIPDKTPSNRSISPETYIGSKRMQYYYPSNSLPNGTSSFIINKNPPVDTFSLGGKWNIYDEYSQSLDKSSLVYNFYADKVFLVMNSENKNSTVEIYLDGKLISKDNSGSDVFYGIINIDKNRLYNLVDLKNGPENHTLEIKFNTPKIKTFAFTFG